MIIQFFDLIQSFSLLLLNRDSVNDENVPKRISRAYKLGRNAKKVATCQEKFYMCPYSGNTMLTIIDLQSRLLG